MAESEFLLTCLEGIPIVIACADVGDKIKFTKKNSLTLSQSTFDHNVKSGDWVQETNIPFIAKSLEKHVGDYECWIRREDAFA